MSSQYLTNPHAERFQTTEWSTKNKLKEHRLQSVVKSKLLSNRHALLTGWLQYQQQFEHGRIYFHFEN